MTVITLTTDFGTGDHEAGVLKGVIWQIAPDAKIADLSHDIRPHDITSAALLLWRATPFFPNGSIHVVVVDPGVGTARRGIAAQIGSQYFVGPDNGIITMLHERAFENNAPMDFVELDVPKYWLPEVSNVFHGRDIFAPVAAHLALGIPLREVGAPITDLVMLELPKPVQIPGGWLGKVIHIDHFGNLATNLRTQHVNQTQEVIVKIKGRVIAGLVSTFGEKPPGTLVALLDSSASLAISLVSGNAAQNLDAGIGDDVEVLIEK
ncbi:MAG: hypothetical protein A2136_04455 [Chloroflexi bacterium RBG_16_54_11]|nr:MAG: hypothetical protein A2136_04455 [Chloroflexi bacterium RBG_16_54_11]